MNSSHFPATRSPAEYHRWREAAEQRALALRRAAINEALDAAVHTVAGAARRLAAWVRATAARSTAPRRQLEI